MIYGSVRDILDLATFSNAFLSASHSVAYPFFPIVYVCQISFFNFFLNVIYGRFYSSFKIFIPPSFYPAYLHIRNACAYKLLHKETTVYKVKLLKS